MMTPLTQITPYFRSDDATIIHGDCQDVLPKLPPASVDLVVTDPPYIVGYRGRWDSKTQMIKGDDDPSWIEPVFTELYRVLKPNTFAISFYSWPHADIFVGTFKSLGFRIVSHLAFVKKVWALGRFTRGQHETAYLLAKGKPKIPERAISDVIEWTRDSKALHPNQKPVGALRPLIETWAPASGLVLDPFMGSGSTLLAAHDFGLPAIGIECEEQWCRYARRDSPRESCFR